MTKDMNENGTFNPYIVTGDEVKADDRYGYKIIAVVQSEHFWAAYYGLTDWSDERVASGGEKVPYDVAKWFFSTIDAMIPNYNH